MLKINKKLSVNITIMIDIICILAITLVALTAFNYTELWFGAKDVRPQLSIVIFAYLEIAVAYVAAFILFSFLKKIRKSEVFTERNVSCLRALSYCCYAEGLIFVTEAIVICFDSAFLLKELFITVIFLVAFACAFMGTIVRVIKNAFEEALAIKNENDFTI